MGIEARYGSYRRLPDQAGLDINSVEMAFPEADKINRLLTPS